jgi:predicted nucleic acid-binding protein
MELPGVVVLQPGPRHLPLLQRAATESGAVGPLLTDAILAALALETGAKVASTDRDFARFPASRWVNPLSK